MNRRHFVKTAALAGASTLALRGKAWPFAQSPSNIRKFVVSLPGLGPSAKNEIGQYLPLATKHTTTFAGQTTDLYSIATAPSTENPYAGTTEVWQIMNLTGDTHPIHFHLVNVQLIQRQPFTGDPSDWGYSGPPIPPEPNELGWKETVRMNPGEITTVIMKFDLPQLPTAAMRDAVSPRTGGREYVWHCHILEHEEHDMMRPLIVR